MFSRIKRVKTKDFDEILNKGRVIHGDFIYIRYLSGKDKKFSVVIPKKVLPKAFARNRLKRKINGILRGLEDGFKSGKYLVFAKNGADSLDNVELKNDILKLVSRK